MADFIKAYSKLLPVEGGYVNDPDDTGKETYKGISRKWHPSWAGWKMIDQYKGISGFPARLSRDLTLQKMVQDFYEAEYWNKIMGKYIPHQEVADELFDTAVNMGTGVAIQFLEASLNLLNRNGTLFPDVKPDAVMDHATIQRLNALPYSDAPFLLRALNAYQAARYISICEKNPTQEKFFRGWIKRT